MTRNQFTFGTIQNRRLGRFRKVNGPTKACPTRENHSMENLSAVEGDLSYTVPTCVQTVQEA